MYIMLLLGLKVNSCFINSNLFLHPLETGSSVKGIKLQADTVSIVLWTGGAKVVDLRINIKA